MNNNRGGFLNGFLWGAIIGGIVVFLLTSKKGKKLLKLLTEEGLEGVSELEELLGDNVDEEEPLPQTEEKHHSNGNGEGSTLSKIKSTGRRFFKRVPRKN